MTKARAASPFSRGAVLGIVVVGFVAFVAMLYFLSVGDTGDGDANNGDAHALSNGLAGYSGLAQLLESEGYDVIRSREGNGLDVAGLLILTPPDSMDAAELSNILRRRAYRGPTMVIVPKWMTVDFPQNLPAEQQAKIKDGWVQLVGARQPDWLGKLEEPYAMQAKVVTYPRGKATWEGLGASAVLPESPVLGASDEGDKETLVVDPSGRALAVTYVNEDEYGDTEDTHPVTFIVEPDLVNNYGLSDPKRAALAMRLVEDAGYGKGDLVTFDLTTNGLGAQVNLLTLAFRPPFLAATLCLILAMLIVGWRAFKRFGPTLSSGPDIAFGKSQLVSNGAGLIVRAKRLRLLADPYADLSARRLGQALGLAKPDPAAIDAAIRRRLPNEEPFSPRAERLREARTPSEILRAAQALKELEGKLSK